MMEEMIVSNEVRGSEAVGGELEGRIATDVGGKKLADDEARSVAVGSKLDPGQWSRSSTESTASSLGGREAVSPGLSGTVGGSEADMAGGSKVGGSKATSMSGMSIEIPIRRSVSRASFASSFASSTVSQHPKVCLSESFLKSFLKDEPEAGRPVSSIFTGNIRVLLFTALLFGMITVAQVIAAEISNSEALMADCVSMAVDALTYFLNIFVELRKGESMHRQLQLFVPSISIAILVYFTVGMVFEAWATLNSPTEELDDVNPWIVGGFAVWGIIFDMFALKAFMDNAKSNSQEDDTLPRLGEASLARQVSFGSDTGGEQLVQDGGSGTEVNMLAAFAHVGADFARSITTLVAALMIACWDLDGPSTDAWACLLVSGMILLGACATAVQIVKDFCSRDGAREVALLDA